MLPEARDKAYLWDISTACEDVLSFINGRSFDEFSTNKMLRFAVERQLLVIGEAANHLSAEFTAQHQEIPWRKIVGLRNIIAHDYGELLAERVWLTAKNEVPALLEAIRKLS